MLPKGPPPPPPCSRPGALIACPLAPAAKRRTLARKRGGSLGQRRDLRRDRDRHRSRGVRGRDPRRPDGPQDRDRGARPRRLRGHLPPARVHPHEGAPPHRRPLRGPEAPQGVRDPGRERGARLPRGDVAQGPDRPPPQQGDRDLPLQEEQDHALQGTRPPRGGEGRRREGRGGRDEGRHEERHPRHRLPAEVASRASPRTARRSSPRTRSCSSRRSRRASSSSAPARSGSSSPRCSPASARR